jgi:hypothetical protein
LADAGFRLGAPQKILTCQQKALLHFSLTPSITIAGS